MLSKADVLNKLQAALPKTSLMWQDEAPGRATVIVTQKEAEHYVGIALDEVGLTADELVRSIVSAVTFLP